MNWLKNVLRQRKDERQENFSWGRGKSFFFYFRNYWKFYASVFIAVLIFESRTLTSRITQCVDE